MQVTNILQAPAFVFRFVREARDELRKVSWPSRQTTIRYTIIVIVACLITAVVIGAIDYVLTWILENLIV